ncbi:hypothetical protein NMY22_g2726 [Coprinellus aureogranulatus]|nr:hypothetical protein NMY22_g2726 [Coprinellus aureogranulatus]
MADVSKVVSSTIQASDPAPAPAAAPSHHSLQRATQGLPGMPDLNTLRAQMEYLGKMKGAYDALLAQFAPPEPPPVDFTAADVPPLIESLSSLDFDTFNKGTRSLNSISERQPELLNSDVLPHVPYILSIIPNLPDVPRQRAVVNLLSLLSSGTPEFAAALVQHIDLSEVVWMLKKSQPAAREAQYALLHLLHNVLRADFLRRDDKTTGGEKLKQRLVPILQNQFYTFGSKVDAADGKGKAKATRSGDWNMEEALTVIKVLELVFPQDHALTFIRPTLFRAGAMEFLIRVASTPSDNPALEPSVSDPVDPKYPPLTITALRVEAITCLTQLYKLVAKEEIIPSNFAHISYSPDAKFDLQGRILMPLLDIIDDKDIVLSDEVADFMCERFADLDGAVEVYLWTHEGSMERLVHKIGLSGGKKGKGQDKGILYWRESLQMSLQWVLKMVKEDHLSLQLFKTMVRGTGTGDLPLTLAREKNLIREEKLQFQMVQEAAVNCSSNQKHLQQEDSQGHEREQKQIQGKDREQEASVTDKSDDSSQDQEHRDDHQKHSPDHSMSKAHEGKEKQEQEPESVATTGEIERGEEATSISNTTAGQTHHESLSQEDAKPQNPQQKSTEHGMEQYRMKLTGENFKYLRMLQWADSHSQAEWLFAKALKENFDGGVDALRTFWGRRDVDEKVKHELCRVLSVGLPPVQEAGVSAGLLIPVTDQEVASAQGSNEETVESSSSGEKECPSLVETEKGGSGDREQDGTRNPDSPDDST